jgi:hypothetical protein
LKGEQQAGTTVPLSKPPICQHKSYKNPQTDSPSNKCGRIGAVLLLLLLLLLLSCLLLCPGQQWPITMKPNKQPDA